MKRETGYLSKQEFRPPPFQILTVQCCNQHFPTPTTKRREKKEGRQVSLLVHCWHMQKKRQCHKVCISCSKYETKGYPSAFNCCNVSSPFRCLSSYLKPVLWLWIIVTLLRATQIRHSGQPGRWNGVIVYDVFSPICACMMYSVRSVPGKHTNMKTVQVFFTVVSLPGRSRFHLKPCRSIYPVEPCGFGVEVSLI